MAVNQVMVRKALMVYCDRGWVLSGNTTDKVYACCCCCCRYADICHVAPNVCSKDGHLQRLMLPPYALRCSGFPKVMPNTNKKPGTACLHPIKLHCLWYAAAVPQCSSSLTHSLTSTPPVDTADASSLFSPSFTAGQQLMATWKQSLTDLCCCPHAGCTLCLHHCRRWAGSPASNTWT